MTYFERQTYHQNSQKGILLTFTPQNTDIIYKYMLI